MPLSPKMSSKKRFNSQRDGILLRLTDEIFIKFMFQSPTDFVKRRRRFGVIQAASVRILIKISFAQKRRLKRACVKFYASFDAKFDPKSARRFRAGFAPDRSADLPR